MNQVLRNIALCFAAGCGGALIRSLLSFGAAHFGFTFVIGAAGALQPGVLYPRIVWGGLWGLLFLITLMRKSFWFGVVLAALVITLLQWVVLPLWWQHTMHLALMPMVNGLLLNLIWAAATALLLKWI